MTERQLNALLELGARRWTKGGKDRLYLSGALDDLFGLEVQRYKSGSISSVSGMSNNKYRKMHAALDGVYINMITGGIGGTIGGSYTDQLTDILNQKYRKPKVVAKAAAAD